MNALSITILSLCGIYMLMNFKHDLHMLQQNSYRPERYWRWLEKGDISSTWRMADLCMLFLLMASNYLPYQLASLIIAIVCVGKCFMILRKKHKKPLVMTKRVWRLYAVVALLSAGGVAATAICTRGEVYAYVYNGFRITLFLLLVICILSWAVVYIALYLLMPVETAVNNGYKKDAMRRLKAMPDLKVIGITGSYGKTSTKHYLQRILSEKYETLMTPGSYNTPMGVVRTIREMMKPYTEVFICEMGAKQKGDIKEICDIVHPQIGIITAVGPMHLETFKSIENVQATKFELADAVPADGLVVVNNDFEYCAGRPVENTRCIRYAAASLDGAEYVAEDIKYCPEGTVFTLKGPDGLSIPFETKLVGECNVSNLVAAIIIGLKLEVPVAKIQYAVRRIEQVEHRLSMTRTPGGITIIDDAFNSNPSGSKMAVDVLAQFPGKRIIVTPGMVELGDRQYELNKEFGRYLGDRVDVAIIVGEYNREAIVDGIKESGLNESALHIVDTFPEAQALLGGMMAAGDAVLYENDLPDSFK